MVNTLCRCPRLLEPSIPKPLKVPSVESWERTTALSAPTKPLVLLLLRLRFSRLFRPTVVVPLSVHFGWTSTLCVVLDGRSRRCSLRCLC